MRVKREKMLLFLVEHLLEKAGVSLLDTLDVENWRFEFTITNEQYLEFKKFAIKELQKTFKFNKTKANNTFNWFYKNYGLRIKNYEL